ncbi:MAG: DNA alkylation repair protein [Candidatus Norongarragalinales archaeon]
MVKTAGFVSRELKALANARKAKTLAGFFKTGKGQYGEGDFFYGVSVPETRRIATKYSRRASLEDARALLGSRVHEERLAALLILVGKFERASAKEKKRIFDFYWRNAKRVNNWDLVDLSAGKIVGAYLDGKNKSLLKRLAESESVWERRIAIVATLHFIKKGSCKEVFEIARALLQDKHDLIRKATGWMLREAGKRCGEKTLENFLDKHASEMPRAMLRYAVERFPEAKRKLYLSA